MGRYSGCLFPEAGALEISGEQTRSVIERD